VCFRDDVYHSGIPNRCYASRILFSEKAKRVSCVSGKNQHVLSMVSKVVVANSFFMRHYDMFPCIDIYSLFDETHLYSSNKGAPPS